MNTVCQIAIGFFGLTALWFVTQKKPWSRWGYILGLSAQPFWYYTTITHRQWGILLISAAYTLIWLQGFWKHWMRKET